MTVPESVKDEVWEQTFEVYVEDKYDQGIKQFFEQNNPWSYQSVTARMVEAVRKDFWDADEETEKKIVEEYIESVLKFGLSCSDNTCANPLMHSHVIDVASKFMPIEKINELQKMLKETTGKTLAEQNEELKQVKNKLAEGFNDRPIERNLENEVQGFKMEKMDTKEKKPENAEHSDIPALLFSLFIVMMVAAGMVTGLKRDCCYESSRKDN